MNVPASLSPQSRARLHNDKALHVLHVIESLAPGGAEQVLGNLLPCLKGLGIDAELAVLWPPYDLVDTLRASGITVHELNIPSPWRVDRIPGLRRLIRDGGFDLVHAHLPMSVFYSAMSRGSTPVVATFHGLSFEMYPPTTVAKKLRRQAERWWTNHRIDAYIAVSDSVAEHYHETLRIPRARIQVIPNGFPVAKLARNALLDRGLVRARYGVGPGDFLLLHAGRLQRHKGHTYLLQALAKLDRQGLDFRALCFGAGSLQFQIEAAIEEYGLSRRVRLHPPVSHAELAEVLQAADLFVFPSISEGFGMAAGEAMCLGVPVIASDLPGISSLIESGVSGLLVPPADPGCLAAAVRRLMTDDSLRARLAEGGRQRIHTHFREEIIAERIANLYRSIVT